MDAITFEKHREDLMKFASEKSTLEVEGMISSMMILNSMYEYQRNYVIADLKRLLVKKKVETAKATSMRPHETDEFNRIIKKGYEERKS